MGDGNVPCYVILLSLMLPQMKQMCPNRDREGASLGTQANKQSSVTASFLCLAAAAAGADCNGSVMVSRQEGHSQDSKVTLSPWICQYQRYHVLCLCMDVAS